ncbi:MAG: hypothetical protein ACE5D7_10810, partial [Fidelibacterota bacterium]
MQKQYSLLYGSIKSPDMNNRIRKYSRILLVLILTCGFGEEFSGLSDIFILDSTVDGFYDPPAFYTLSAPFTVNSTVDGFYEPTGFFDLSVQFLLNSTVDGNWEGALLGETGAFVLDSEAPSVEVISPNGGEVFDEGSTFPV